jgi:hypothetical protein
MIARAVATKVALAAALGLGSLLAASCTTRAESYAHCDYVVRRCRTVCDYWCDGWGCYPVCYDQCWNECYIKQPPPAEPAPPADQPPPAEPAPPPSGPPASGVLCSPCESNDDCGNGALCIVRGGAAAQDGGFCGHPCQVSTECPAGFACTEIGASRQCLPTGDRCE